MTCENFQNSGPSIFCCDFGTWPGNDFYALDNSLRRYIPTMSAQCLIPDRNWKTLSKFLIAQPVIVHPELQDLCTLWRSTYRLTSEVAAKFLTSLYRGYHMKTTPRKTWRETSNPAEWIVCYAWFFVLNEQLPRIDGSQLAAAKVVHFQCRTNFLKRSVSRNKTYGAEFIKVERRKTLGREAKTKVARQLEAVYDAETDNATETIL